SHYTRCPDRRSVRLRNLVGRGGCCLVRHVPEPAYIAALYVRGDQVKHRTNCYSSCDSFADASGLLSRVRGNTPAALGAAPIQKMIGSMRHSKKGRLREGSKI